MAKTRPNIIYKKYLRRAEAIRDAKDKDITRVKTRKYNLEAKAYEAYAEGIISKEECDDIFDLLEE
jgi:hypothetical protein